MKILKNLFLFCLITSCTFYTQTESPWKLWCPAFMEQHYAELKEAVCTKMGADFTTTFNAQYPQSSVEGVQALALHIDSLTAWQECHPPRATATIGTQKIPLQGDIAFIIYGMHNNKVAQKYAKLQHPIVYKRSLSDKILERFAGLLVAIFGPYL